MLLITLLGGFSPTGAKTNGGWFALIVALGSIPLGPFVGDEPLTVRLQVELVSDACRQSNDWKFWVFPKKKDLPAAAICNLTGEPSLDARYGASTALSAGDAKVMKKVVVVK